MKLGGAEPQASLPMEGYVKVQALQAFLADEAVCDTIAYSWPDLQKAIDEATQQVM